MIFYVTNRKLCQGDFLQRMERLASGKPDGIILREKDLPPAEYEELASEVGSICEKHNVPMIINQNVAVAKKLRHPHIQLSMENLRKYHNDLELLSSVGASVHSVDEAAEAESLGATYLIAGHIFATDSKKGLPPRGLSFLEKIIQNTSLPVLAIGGITAENAGDVLRTGAKGVCVMSGPMKCLNPSIYAKTFKACF